MSPKSCVFTCYTGNTGNCIYKRRIKVCLCRDGFFNIVLPICCRPCYILRAVCCRASVLNRQRCDTVRRAVYPAAERACRTRRRKSRNTRCGICNLYLVGIFIVEVNSSAVAHCIIALTNGFGTSICRTIQCQCLVKNILCAV